MSSLGPPYHEAFWAAVAATAPVIALANTVVLTDALRSWGEFRELPGAPQTTLLGTQKLGPNNPQRVAIAGFGQGALAILLQTVVLVVALISLQRERPLLDPDFVILMEAVSLFGVGIMTAYGSLVRIQLAQIRQKAGLPAEPKPEDAGI